MDKKLNNALPIRYEHNLLQDLALIESPTSTSTVSGRYIDLANVKEFDINLDDLCHGMAGIPRYNRQTKDHYSVAEHCLLCERKAPDNCDSMLRLALLFHDAAEYLTGDIISPVKYLFPEIKLLEKNILNIIYNVYNVGVAYRTSPLIKQIDSKMYRTEQYRLRRNEYPMYADHYKDVTFHCYGPTEAYHLFKTRALELIDACSSSD